MSGAKFQVSLVLNVLFLSILVTGIVLLCAKKGLILRNDLSVEGEETESQRPPTLNELFERYDSEQKAAKIEAKRLQTLSREFANVDIVELQLKRCECTKTIRRLKKSKSVDYSLTTCSEEAYQRGSGQKVASFGFFSTQDSQRSKRKYFEGIAMNAQALSNLHPDFVMRVYHNLTSEESTSSICELSCQFDNLDFCHIRDIPLVGSMQGMQPTTWRFIALLDPQVSLSTFRDLDSLITPRESSAVEAWMSGHRMFHFMRDHPAHDMPILAGMWGVKTDTEPETRIALHKVMRAMLRDSMTWMDSMGSNDQFLLEKYIWPWARDLALQHDSYLCGRFGRFVPWPTERPSGPNNFVGAPFALRSSVSEKCPVKCRPKDHQDWEKC